MLESPWVFPKSALFGRTVHKNKIYTRSRVSNRVKALFVEQIEKLQWKYKLSPETINLPATDAVQELQIFEIRLKADQLSPDVLKTIDRAVPSPIIFQVTTDSDVQFIACYKRPSLADRSSWVISEYFMSDWIPNASRPQPLPVVLDLEVLYEKLLEQLLPYDRYPTELMPHYIQRVETLNRLTREIGIIEKRLANEKQFNRKVALNQELRELMLQRDGLSN